MTSNSTASADCLYLLNGGHIFTSARYAGSMAAAYHGSILFSLGGDPFSVRIDDKERLCRAIALRPGVVRTVDALSRTLVCVRVTPRHPGFRQFSLIGGDGAVELGRIFDPFNFPSASACCGKLTPMQATTLFDDLVRTTTRHLPRCRPSDARTQRMFEFLDDVPLATARDLGRAFNLSTGRISHLFRASAGLPIKTYQKWRRMHLASLHMGNGKSLADIVRAAGYVDASHFGREFREVAGVSPSSLLQNDQVKVFNWRGRAAQHLDLRPRHAA